MANNFDDLRNVNGLVDWEYMRITQLFVNLKDNSVTVDLEMLKAKLGFNNDDIFKPSNAATINNTLNNISYSPTNPYAQKGAKIYGPEILEKLKYDDIRAIVAVHGEAMLDYFDKMHAEGMPITSWTDTDTLRLINTRLGRVKLAKILFKQTADQMRQQLRNIFRG